MQLEIYKPSTSSWVPITSWIAADGVKFGDNAVEGPNAGRVQSGKMVRDLICYKLRLDLTCIAITHTVKETIRDLIKPETFQFRFRELSTDPWIEIEAYSNNWTWQSVYVTSSGALLYKGFSFPVIEV